MTLVSDKHTTLNATYFVDRQGATTRRSAKDVHTVVHLYRVNPTGARKVDIHTFDTEAEAQNVMRQLT